MKKVSVIILIMALILTLFTSCNSTKKKADIKDSEPSVYKCAVITSLSGVDDGTVNQCIYESVQLFSDQKMQEYNHYQATSSEKEDIVAVVNTAIKENCNIIFMCGSVCTEALLSCSEENENIKFIGIDITKDDLLRIAVADKNEQYDDNPDNWDLNKYCDLSNVYCAGFDDETNGFIAGYTAVKIGYTKLGFLGALNIPSVKRFGYGFVQGVDTAAYELQIKDAEIKYAYAGQYASDPRICDAVKKWYESGTKAVMSYGGVIYKSVAEAAQSYNGKIIGSDIDQSGIIDTEYGKDITITSAVKGIFNITNQVLSAIVVDKKWSDYAGKVETLGINVLDDPEKLYIGIPVNTTQFVSEQYTLEEYNLLLTKLYNKEYELAGDISKYPDLKSITVNYMLDIIDD